MRFKIFREKQGGILQSVINEGKTPKWYWHLLADNGKVIADSGEGYNSLHACKHGVDLVKGAANNTPVDED